MEIIAHTRYLRQRRPPAQKGNLYDHLKSFREHHADKFRSFLRMSPSAFDHLVSEIEDNAIFHNNSNNSQGDVDLQLAVFLFRVGHFGNAASVSHISYLFGVAEGSVVTYTYRVLTAVLHLRTTYIGWPDATTVESAKRWVGEQSGCAAWKGGYMAIDGTTIPLATKPGRYGEQYFDKSSQYSINAQVKCLIYF